MKATGIVRRIDDLGRVVIPKEIRRTQRIRMGDPLEIFTSPEGEVIFKKYSPIGELSSFAGEYAEVLFKIANLPIVVTDRDHIVAVGGLPKKDFIDKRVSNTLEQIMESRRIYTNGSENDAVVTLCDGCERTVGAVAPIINQGDVIGSVVFVAPSANVHPNETDVKLISVAAAFLAKQMEE
ncbi:MAG: stage V sporulation T C-terminal domain-containing protein [Oscillospiraceae bacterium]|nr:stage V sporulation T C-terminal domain-containing protein [Oscillospiraceae bacterium]